MLILMSCADAKRGGEAAKVAVVDCGKQLAPGLAAAVARWGVQAAIAGEVDWDSIETGARGLGLGAGSCAVAEFLLAWKDRPRPAAAAARLGESGTMARGQVALERLRAELGGARLRLADGTVL